MTLQKVLYEHHYIGSTETEIMYFKRVALNSGTSRYLQ